MISLLLRTLRYGDYGLQLDVCFSLLKHWAEYNNWRENVKLRLQTTDNRL